MENCDKYRFDEKMFHVKHLIFLTALLISLLLCKSIKCFCGTTTIESVLNTYNYVFWQYDNSNTDYSWNLYAMNNQPLLYPNKNGNGYEYVFTSDPVASGTFTFRDSYTSQPRIYANLTDQTITIIYKGYDQSLYGSYSNIFNGYEAYYDYINPTPPVPDPWYKNLWGKFVDELDRENTVLQNFVRNIGETISNWWKKINGDLPEHDGTHGKFGVADFATPTPFPSPTPRPTPIPYSTVIHDDGNGNSSIFYQYTNPQGTPTESPINPNINYNFDTNINFNGGDRNNPIYVQDVGNPQFTSIIDLSDNTISVNIGNLDDSIDMVADPLAESAQDIPTAVGGFSAIPDDLMIIIGCMACIPLIAGIIGRFLK